MAHSAKIKVVPHRNKNGTISKTKKDYNVVCRSRGKVCFEVLGLSTKANAEELIELHRQDAFIRHHITHPNDLAHQQKHKSEPVVEPVIDEIVEESA